MGGRGERAMQSASPRLPIPVSRTPVCKAGRASRARSALSTAVGTRTSSHVSIVAPDARGSREAEELAQGPLARQKDEDGEQEERRSPELRLGGLPDDLARK